MSDGCLAENFRRQIQRIGEAKIGKDISATPLDLLVFDSLRFSVGNFGCHLLLLCFARTQEFARAEGQGASGTSDEELETLVSETVRTARRSARTPKRKVSHR